MPDTRRLLTITAAARELSYSSRYINELIRRGRLDAIGRRRGRRVVAASIDRYIAEEQEREEAER